ncbi:MAG: TAXI family TRAP transporter solute-binding subunit [Sulfolobales archaeon]
MRKTLTAVIAVLVIIVAIAGVLVWQQLQTQPTTSPTPTASPSAPAPTATSPTTTPTPTTKLVIQWGTASVGSAGYTALALIADIINRNMQDLEISVVPTAGAVASIKSYSTGELGGCYASTPSFTELYTLSGRFKGFEPKRYPYQTFWAYTLEIGIAIHQRNIGKYKCWSDLNGVKMFTGPAGWDVGVALRTALNILNISYEHIELDWGMLADALERGTIEATIIYTTAYYGLPDWARQLELSVPIAILNPCPNEIEILKREAPKTGIIDAIVNYVEPKQVFSTDVKLTSGDKISGVAFFYGFHVGSEVPADVVYRMLKVLEANAGELAKLNPMFRLLADDFVGMQVRGIEANSNVPVHPGLAKYLKEKGVWRDHWKIGG